MHPGVDDVYSRWCNHVQHVGRKAENIDFLPSQNPNSHTIHCNHASEHVEPFHLFVGYSQQSIHRNAEPDQSFLE